uniref:Uncharacterized protein n=1 Tax=Eutreptiella gymnastica TaxID=73025 RepID=A0A7S4GL96_9EUGL
MSVDGHDVFSTGSTNVSQPTESGHPSHVTSTLYKNETSEEIEEDGELPCGPELAEFLKAKDHEINELTLRCDYLQGKDVRAKQMMDEVTKDLFNQVLQLKLMLEAKEEALKEQQTEAEEKHHQTIVMLSHILQEKFEKEKDKIHSVYYAVLTDAQKTRLNVQAPRDRPSRKPQDNKKLLEAFARGVQPSARAVQPSARGGLRSAQASARGPLRSARPGTPQGSSVKSDALSIIVGPTGDDCPETAAAPEEDKKSSAFSLADALKVPCAITGTTDRSTMTPGYLKVHKSTSTRLGLHDVAVQAFVTHKSKAVQTLDVQVSSPSGSPPGSPLSPKTSFGSASSIISEPEPGTPSSRKKGHKGSQPSSPAPSSPQRASPRSGSRSKKSGSFRSITHEHEPHSPHQSELGERTPSPADLGTLGFQRVKKGLRWRQVSAAIQLVARLSPRDYKHKLTRKGATEVGSEEEGDGSQRKLGSLKRQSSDTKFGRRGSNSGLLLVQESQGKPKPKRKASTVKNLPRTSSELDRQESDDPLAPVRQEVPPSPSRKRGDRSASPKRVQFKENLIENKAPYIDKSIVRANERIQELQVDNLHLSYYGTSILRELQDEKQAVAQMRDQIQSLEERQKIYIEELAGRAADVMRLEALLLSTQQSHSRNAKSQEAETQKRVSLALQVCNGLRSDLRQAQLDNEQFQAKARQKCHLMTLACDKRDEVMLRLRKSLRDERQSKASESKLLCNNCESMLYHLNAMEQELDHRSRTMDAKVRTLAGDLAAARALAAPDAQYLSAVHEKILQGLRLFERLDAENEVLRERAEGLRILNQGLEDKVIALTLQLQGMPSDAASTSTKSPATSAREQFVPVALNANRVPVKAMKYLEDVATHAAQASVQPSVQMTPKHVPDDPASKGRTETTEKLEAAMYILNLLIRTSEETAQRPSEWDLTKEHWAARAKRIQSLPKHKRVVAQAQLLLDKMLVCQRLIPQRDTDQLNLVLDTPHMEASDAHRAEQMLDAQAEVSVGDLPSAISVPEPAAIAEPLGPWESDSLSKPGNQSLPLPQRNCSSPKKLTATERALIKEALNPQLASSNKRKPSPLFHPQKVDLRFNSRSAAGAGGSTSGNNSSLLQRRMQAAKHANSLEGGPMLLAVATAL